MSFDFEKHLQRQRDFSERTFGPGARAAGIVDHIRRELKEIEAAPTDLSEWVDVVILGLDGAWRAGYTPAEIIAAIVAKQDKNEARDWPDWRTADPDKAIEHDRSKDAAPVFKVGDPVLIARKVDHCAFSWVHEMDEFIGRIGRIREVDTDDGTPAYRVAIGDEAGWMYSAEALIRLPCITPGGLRRGSEVAIGLLKNPVTVQPGR